VAPIAVDDYCTSELVFNVHVRSYREDFADVRHATHPSLEGLDMKKNTIKWRESRRLTSRTLAGVLIKKWLPLTPLGPSLTLIAGIPSLSMAHVCQNPTPAIREMASSVVNSSRILDRSAFANSEGDIFAGVGQRLEALIQREGTYIPASQTSAMRSSTRAIGWWGKQPRFLRGRSLNQ
jgi:hypothetical protein